MKIPFEEIFGSEIYTPIGQYILTIGPDIVNNGWMIIIGIVQNNQDIGSAIVETSATKIEAIAAHNFWAKAIIDHPPTILHDIKLNTNVIIPNAI